MRNKYYNKKFKVNFKTKMFKDFCNPINLSVFSFFTKSSAVEYADLAKAKQTRIKFLYMLLNFPNLFKPQGTQLCTVELGNSLGVSSSTVLGWLEILIDQKYLKCTCNIHVRGFKSKCYALVINSKNSTFLHTMSTHSGFYKKRNISEDMQKLHTKRLEQVDKMKSDLLEVNYNDFIYLASLYKGRPDLFLKAVNKNFSSNWLKEPRSMNLNESHFHGLIHAFNYVHKISKQINKCIYINESKKGKFYITIEDEFVCNIDESYILPNRADLREYVIAKILTLRANLKYMSSYEKKRILATRINELEVFMSPYGKGDYKIPHKKNVKNKYYLADFHNEQKTVSREVLRAPSSHSKNRIIELITQNSFGKVTGNLQKTIGRVNRYKPFNYFS